MSKELRTETLSRREQRSPHAGKGERLLRALMMIITVILFNSPQADLYAFVVMDEAASALHPVVEPDWLSVLENKAREAARLGLIDAEREKARKRLKEHAARPVEVLLPRAEKKTRTSAVIFSAKRAALLSRDVRELVPGFERTYIFINADDKEQVKWLCDSFKKERPSAELKEGRMDLPTLTPANARIVAVAGDVQKISREMRTRIWADQGGTLVRRFSVTALPAIARLNGRKKSTGEIDVVLDVESFVLGQRTQGDSARCRSD